MINDHLVPVQVFNSDPHLKAKTSEACIIIVCELKAGHKMIRAASVSGCINDVLAKIASIKSRL